MQYKRIMCVDYGDARMGIAFSDLLQMIANPYETYKRVNEETDILHLTSLAKQQSVEKIILGMPYSMDGTENERTELTKQFGYKLNLASGICVDYFDERLSSHEAEEILKRNKVQPKDRKKHLDQLAAAVILQSYLNSKN